MAIVFNPRKVAAARAEVGIAGRQMARHLGLSENFCHRIERGMHPLTCKELALIASFLGKPAEYFFDAVDDTPQEDMPEPLAMDVTPAPQA